MILSKRIKTLLEKRSYKFKLPLNYSEEDKFFFNNEVSKNFDEVNLYQISKINVTEDGILFKKFKIHPISYVWNKHIKDFYTKYLFKQYFSKKKEVIQSNNPILICFDYWSIGYYHWICECLPRIFIASKQMQNAIVVLPESYKRDYIQTSLQLLGIKTINYFSNNNYIHCNSVFITDKLCPSGDIEINTIKELIKEIKLNYTAISTVTSHKWVYVSRKKATKRKISNELEVEKLLVNLGFEIICFEDYTFSEQINLLKNTELMISPHGANLTNMLFMPQQSSVIELRRQDNDGRNFYFSLSAVNNQNYYYLKCNYIEETHDLFDLTVDILKLETLIKTIKN